MNDNLTLYLLTIRGTLSPSTLEEARKVHNMTAGDPDGIVAAKSLGDVSHMVYVPMPHNGHAKSNGAGEYLIMGQLVINITAFGFLSRRIPRSRVMSRRHLRGLLSFITSFPPSPTRM